jgi:hypothetical protein
MKLLCQYNYRWAMQIAKSKDHNSIEFEFPVGFYNPNETKINIGVIIDEQFAGHYTIMPFEIQLLFKNEIYPFIPDLSSKGSDANINILMENNKELLIVYCKLPWNEIEQISLKNEIILLKSQTDIDLYFEYDKKHKYTKTYIPSNIILK